MTAEAGASEIPELLAGEKPFASSSNLGTRNYNRVPIAVIVGASELYGDEGITLMRSAVDAMQGARPVPWGRPDKSVIMPPIGPEYGKRMVERVKESITRLKAENKLDGSTSEIFLY